MDTRQKIGERVFAYSNGNRSYCSILNDRKEIIQKLLKHHGGVAQLGEHLPCKQGVKGSNPFISTNIVKAVCMYLENHI